VRVSCIYLPETLHVVASFVDSCMRSQPLHHYVTAAGNAPWLALLVLCGDVVVRPAKKQGRCAASAQQRRGSCSLSRIGRFPPTLRVLLRPGSDQDSRSCACEIWGSTAQEV
jgi:hypothetical protein